MFVLVTVLIQVTRVNINLKLLLIFPEETMTAQSANESAYGSDVTSLGTGKELNFDDGTLKGKDSYNC